MSTTFQVYPRTLLIPTFQQLLDRSTAELHRFFSSIDIGARPTLAVRMQKNEGHQPIPIELSAPLIWADDAYAWFHVTGVLGGTDAYFEIVDDLILDLWQDFASEPRFKAREKIIRQCLDVGHYWAFRRSAGQSAIINLSYGLIAACLAELTDGIIFSCDSAWDWQRMPATSDEFLSWYFVPDLAIDDDFREWSLRCIAALREELAA